MRKNICSLHYKIFVFAFHDTLDGSCSVVQCTIPGSFSPSSSPNPCYIPSSSLSPSPSQVLGGKQLLNFGICMDDPRIVHGTSGHKIFSVSMAAKSHTP